MRTKTAALFLLAFLVAAGVQACSGNTQGVAVSLLGVAGFSFLVLVSKL